MSGRVQGLAAVMLDICRSAEIGAGVRLRSYQQEAARAIVRSVIEQRGLTFVVVFPRQSGKNELQAQIEAYLLALYSQKGAEIVKVSPTWKPQSQNAMRRLERVLKRHVLTKEFWQKELGYLYRVREASIVFLSASPTANIVGATASTLLECDEAQDIGQEKWDKEIKPMAASTNATRVFWGTAWTSATLLGREKRLAKEAEERDGMRRVWVLTADQVGREVPAYRTFVAGEVARLGRQHPMIRTQFYSEELEGEGGMFPERRLALMRGVHAAQESPQAGRLYAFLLDVAGEDEAVTGRVSGRASTRESWITDQMTLPGLVNPRRDATALTVVEVDLESLGDNAIAAPTYRAVWRRQWLGTAHTRLYAQLRSLGQSWRPRSWVVDATGVGTGLASFLEKAFPGRVLAVTFSTAVKSRLGWDFLGVVETGRWQEHVTAGGEAGALQELFWQQLRYCQMTVLPGPEHHLRWGVPDGQTDGTGAVVHDDLALSAALASLLDGQDWMLSRPGLVATARDPLEEMDEGF